MGASSQEQKKRDIAPDLLNSAMPLVPAELCAMRRAGFA